MSPTWIDDVVSRLVDFHHCPACGAPLSTSRCAACGVDLASATGEGVADLSRKAATALQERERLLERLRSAAAARAYEARLAAQAASPTPVAPAAPSPLATAAPSPNDTAPPFAPPTATPPPAGPAPARPIPAASAPQSPPPSAAPVAHPSPAPIPRPRPAKPKRAPLGVQTILAITGAGLLSAAVLVLVFFTIGSDQVALRGALVTLLAACSGLVALQLRRRSLGQSAEALAALAAALLVIGVGVLAEPASAVMNPAMYWALAILVVAALLASVGLKARMRSWFAIGIALAPLFPILACIALITDPVRPLPSSLGPMALSLGATATGAVTLIRARVGKASARFGSPLRFERTVLAVELGAAVATGLYCVLILSRTPPLGGAEHLVELAALSALAMAAARQYPPRPWAVASGALAAIAIGALLIAASYARGWQSWQWLLGGVPLAALAVFALAVAFGRPAEGPEGAIARRSGFRLGALATTLVAAVPGAVAAVLQLGASLASVGVGADPAAALVPLRGDSALGCAGLLALACLAALSAIARLRRQLRERAMAVARSLLVASLGTTWLAASATPGISPLGASAVAGALAAACLALTLRRARRVRQFLSGPGADRPALGASRAIGLIALAAAIWFSWAAMATGIAASVVVLAAALVVIKVVPGPLPAPPAPPVPLAPPAPLPAPDSGPPAPWSPGEDGPGWVGFGGIVAAAAVMAPLAITAAVAADTSTVTVWLAGLAPLAGLALVAGSLAFARTASRTPAARALAAFPNGAALMLALAALPGAAIAAQRLVEALFAVRTGGDAALFGLVFVDERVQLGLASNLALLVAFVTCLLLRAIPAHLSGGARLARFAAPVAAGLFALSTIAWPGVSTLGAGLIATALAALFLVLSLPRAAGVRQVLFGKTAARFGLVATRMTGIVSLTCALWIAWAFLPAGIAATILLLAAGLAATVARRVDKTDGEPGEGSNISWWLAPGVLAAVAICIPITTSLAAGTGPGASWLVGLAPLAGLGAVGGSLIVARCSERGRDRLELASLPLGALATVAALTVPGAVIALVRVAAALSAIATETRFIVAFEPLPLLAPHLGQAALLAALLLVLACVLTPLAAGPLRGIAHSGRAFLPAAIAGLWLAAAAWPGLSPLAAMLVTAGLAAGCFLLALPRAGRVRHALFGSAASVALGTARAAGLVALTFAIWFSWATVPTGIAASAIVTALTLAVTALGWRGTMPEPRTASRGASTSPGGVLAGAIASLAVAAPVAASLLQPGGVGAQWLWPLAPAAAIGVLAGSLAFARAAARGGPTHRGRLAPALVSFPVGAFATTALLAAAGTALALARMVSTLYFVTARPELAAALTPLPDAIAIGRTSLLAGALLILACLAPRLFPARTGVTLFAARSAPFAVGAAALTTLGWPGITPLGAAVVGAVLATVCLLAALPAAARGRAAVFGADAERATDLAARLTGTLALILGAWFSWASIPSGVAGAVLVLALIALAARLAPAGVRPLLAALALAYALVAMGVGADAAGLAHGWDAVAVAAVTGCLVAAIVTRTARISAATWWSVLGVALVPYLLTIGSVLLARTWFAAAAALAGCLLGGVVLLSRRASIPGLLRTFAAFTLLPGACVVVINAGAQLITGSGSPILLPVVAVLASASAAGAGGLRAWLAARRIAPGVAARSGLAIEVSALVVGAISLGLSFVLAATDLSTSLLLTILLAIGASCTALRPGRRSVWWLAGLLWAAVLWTALARGSIGVPEAYVLPPALAVALAGGLLTLRQVAWRPLAALGLLSAIVPTGVLIWTEPAHAPTRTAGLLAVGAVLAAGAFAVRRWRRSRRLAPVLGLCALPAAACGSVFALTLAVRPTHTPAAHTALFAQAFGCSVAAALVAGAGLLAAALALGRGSRLRAPVRRWWLAPALVLLIGAPIVVERFSWPVVWTMWVMAVALAALVAAVARALARGSTLAPPVWFVWLVALACAIGAWRLRELRVDMYSVPLGIGLLAAGAIAMVATRSQTHPGGQTGTGTNAGTGGGARQGWPFGHSGSMACLAPGLIALFGPSMLATYTDPLTWRAVLVVVGALIAIAVGLRRNLKAPFALGVAILPVEVVIVFGARLGTQIDAAPWWATLAAAGITLLVVAVLYERRDREAHGTAARVRDMT